MKSYALKAGLLSVLIMAICIAQTDSNTPSIPDANSTRSHLSAKRMKDAGFPQEMIAKHGIMMRMRIHTSDPEALLAYRQELKLSEQQVERLKNIARSARLQSEAILSPEQLTEIEKLKGTAETMTQMQRQMQNYQKPRKGRTMYDSNEGG